jgi:hypothetical protein
MYGPCVRALGGIGPRRREAGQQRPERVRRAFQHPDALGEVKVHQIIYLEIGGAWLRRAIRKNTVPSMPDKGAVGKSLCGRMFQMRNCAFYQSEYRSRN